MNSFCIGASINSTALPVISKDGSMEERGNKTECALLQLANKLGYHYEDERK